MIFGTALVENLYQTTGILGVLDAFESLASAERECIQDLIEQVLPAGVVAGGADDYQIQVQRKLDGLLMNEDVRRLVLVGPPDIAILKSLEALRFRGEVRVILNGNLAAGEVDRIRRNVPKKLNIEFDPPTQRLPLLRLTDIVTAIGFDAGADMVLTDRAAPDLIQQLFPRIGDGLGAHLVQPDYLTPVYERTSALKSVSRGFFVEPMRSQPVQRNDAPSNA